jgi:DnaK suppressor protein
MPAAPQFDTAHFPVRPGEEPWTAEELEQVRAELEAEAVGLRADIARAASDIAERLTDAVRDAGDDQADAGTKVFEREHELALTQNAQDLLDQGERALARIDAGTYGVCESCGQPIGKARLQAFPRATLCVICKQRQERR